MTDILKKICEIKQQEIEKKIKKLPFNEIRNLAENLNKNKINGFLESNFILALENKINQNKLAVIGEIKKASPSKGVLRENFNPIEIAKSYKIGNNRINASCLSVLTDEQFFQGKNKYLKQVKESVNLPVLRKDFIINSYQVYETKLIGADAILLIVSCLDSELMQELFLIAKELNLAVLIEVHNEKELEKALKLNSKLIGINNRNLKTFEVNLKNSLDLRKLVPKDIILISESGIKTKEDVKLLKNSGINSFLVGEAFMKEENPGLALANLFE